MSIELIIYLVSLLENICILKALAATGLVLGGFMGIIGHADESIPRDLYRWGVKTFKWSVFIIAFSAFIPTQKTAYLMLGAHFGKEVIQSETASKVQRIIDGKLDQYLKELEK